MSDEQKLYEGLADPLGFLRESHCLQAAGHGHGHPRVASEAFLQLPTAVRSMTQGNETTSIDFEAP